MCHCEERKNRTTIDFENHHRNEAILNKSKITSNQPTKKAAYTITEVLVALAVIGIISMVTLPIFIPKVKDKALARHASVAKIKFTEAMEQMMAEGKIAAYYNDTEDFTDELEGHLKIVKRCNKDNLSDCFGYDKFKLKDNSEYDLSKAKRGGIFKMPDSDTSDFSGDTTAIMTLDGTSMILSWNKKCPRLDPGMYAWSDDTSVATSCVAALIDVNGNEKPNKMGRDIVLLNALGLGEGCGIEFTYGGQSYCWSTPFPANVPLTNADCTANRTAYGINYCRSGNDDYWGGAVKKCSGTKNMPSITELADFASYLYNIPVDNKIGADEDRLKIAKVTSKLPLNWPFSDLFYLWAGEDVSTVYAYNRDYAASASHSNYGGRGSSAYSAICKIR